MGKFSPPEPVNLVCGVIHKADAVFDTVIKRLVETFGPVDLISENFVFDKTDYYTSEMGPNLRKTFYSFVELVPPERIVEIKLTTNRIEEDFTDALPNGGRGRTVNIDPGYVSMPKFVLATTKDFAHRIYLHSNIYAEVTLRFVRGTFIPNEYTYPDYRTPEYIEFLNSVRNLYVEKLRDPGKNRS